MTGMTNRSTMAVLGLQQAKTAKKLLALSLLFLVCIVIARAESGTIPFGNLDPARNAALLHKPHGTHLSEQFIWTKDDAAALDPALQSRVRGQEDKIAPHYFRRVFSLASVPRHATFYIAGPRAAAVFLNGNQILQFGEEASGGKGFHVLHADVSNILHPGKNVLAMQVVRGHSSLHTGASPTINQVTYGEVLAVKIVPGGIAEHAPPLVISDTSWRSTLRAAAGWSSADFDDSSWPLVDSLGIVGSKSDFRQWNADAGLYAWPGYVGISSAMRTFRLPALAVRDATGEARFDHLNPFSKNSSGQLSVLAGAESALTLDFGREVSGRVHLVSASAIPATVNVSYGESAEEALRAPYLGVRTLVVPARGEIYGPKSAFRYVRLSFPANAARIVWSRIDVEGIAYPVTYRGSFESSDSLLNRIWETGAYTAHLCMQEGIWDAPKRDRGRWMGDLDVTGRVINSVFADRALMEQTMEQVLGEPPVRRDVNTIAGYSALWITGQAEFYRHQGDLEYLRKMHPRLLEVLQVMNAELDNNGLFPNPEKHKVFVDWSAGLNTDTPEARAATHFEFYLAYQEAAYLLRELGDTAHASEVGLQIVALRTAAKRLLDPSTETFGDRWQTNAMAIVSGAATVAQQTAIWQHVLAHVGESNAVITPYYGYYVLAAMAKLNHRAEALDWMRTYWGGMLNEGATSFWEAYDPHWPKQDFHAHLEADNKRGYYVSLAHGWASGPTAWLMQQVLGIEPTGRGFEQVSIRPDLAGLAWARGSEPTPHGLLRVSVKPQAVKIVLPPGVVATVSLPFSFGAGVLMQNGRPVQGASAENGRRTIVTVATAGNYVFTLRAGR